MDNFSEQLVKRQPTSSDTFKKFWIAAGGVFLTAVMIILSFLLIGTFWMMIGLIAAAVLGYGTFYLLQGTYVEYEYTFTNGELDIDKIIAKKKRRSLITADVRKFTAFGKYNDNLPETSDMTVVISSDNIAVHEYYADFDHEEYGNVRLVFSPDEAMLGNIKKVLPAKLRNTL